MDKRSEIKEGIKDALRQYLNLERGRNPLDDDATDYLYVVTKSLMNRLHSQGVVIKADRELPVLRLLTYSNKKSAAQAYRNAQNDMLKAGYVAVEPLI